MSESRQVQIDPHTLVRAAERGASAAEILDVIQSGSLVRAKYGRVGRAKVYSFGQARGNKTYPQKRVEVYFIEEPERIVTVTVYVFYGRWERDL